MRYKWPGLAAGLVLVLCGAACGSVDLPNGKHVRVVREMVPPPGGNGVYVLIYRTSSSPGDCPAMTKELDEVWSAVRPRAEGAKVRLATLIAETSSGASAVAGFAKSSDGWKETQPPWACEAKSAQAPR